MTEVALNPSSLLTDLLDRFKQGYSLPRAARDSAILVDDYLRIQDNRHGILMHVSVLSERSVACDMWLLPYTGEIFDRRDFSNNELLLRVIEQETPAFVEIVEIPILENPSVDKLRDMFVRLSYRKTYERDTAPIHKRIQTLKVKEFGGGEFFRAHGKWDGWDFSFQLNGAQASLQIGREDDPEIAPYDTPYWEAQMVCPTEYDESLTLEEWVSIFATLGQNLKPALFRYEFLCPKDGKYVRISGTSLEEAVSQFQLDYGQVGDPDPTPLYLDTRVYPEVRPEFLVHPEGLAE